MWIVLDLNVFNILIMLGFVVFVLLSLFLIGNFFFNCFFFIDFV